jgi:hypothetical protein
MNSRNMNREYKLGTSIGQIAPFQISIKKEQKEILTNKLVITMVIIAIVKIAVLVLWI